MPVPEREWRTPSLAQPKDAFGNENCTRFRMRARLDDGHVRWRGFFDSRDDFDAFLWAIVLYRETGIPVPRPLWDLPSPAWHPDIDPGTSYDFATLTFLTTPTGSNQTYTSPSDWVQSGSNIECVGAGSSGNSAASTGTRGAGAGGGFGSRPNFGFFSPGSTTATYRIGTGGAAVTGNLTSNAGGDTWWNDTVLATSWSGAKGGGAASSGTGGTGGPSASSTGTVTASGGNGASATSVSGGGGAAGPSGAGGNGSGTKGGNANNNTTTGPSTNSNGLSGTEWDGSHGVGTGSFNSTNTTGRLGGLYGGGGNAVTNASASGAGAQGIIVVTYTPAIAPLLTQLERGIRGVTRGVIIGSYH